MSSLTTQTKCRRRIRHAKAGSAHKKTRAKHGTPAFPIHPKGYDPNAPDAKPAQGA